MNDTEFSRSVRALAAEAQEWIEHKSICTFAGLDKPLFLIAAQYPGVWLEHAYDSVRYAQLFPGRTECLRNFLSLWMELQLPSGQLPCYVRKGEPDGRLDVGYGQVQECVSFGRICLLAHEILADTGLLARMYSACARWVGFLEEHRQTRGQGLVEMFVGFDTGHDDSGRLAGMGCPGNYVRDGIVQNASVLPPDDGITPIIPVDMNCNYFGNLTALAQMARLLGNGQESHWRTKASLVKQRLMALCYDPADTFFYDVDRNGAKRRYRSSTIFHLFLEGVLNREEDGPLIDTLLRRYVLSPDEFFTRYPFPSMAKSDPSTHSHPLSNCWGYYAQALIALRCQLWMDDYGLAKEYDHVLRCWLTAYTEHAQTIRFGQEIDPHTGIPTPCAGYYSSGMLLYLTAAQRLGYWK